ncbi:MAG: aminopeptidase P N-terminal domain-containing protein, partial [Owenweeksia sp.]
MKYDKIPSRLFTENRQRFSKHLKSKSIAIFNSNDIMPSNADGTLKFIQNKDIFYLSGADQEESVLVIFPDAFDPKHREILFLKETNDHIARWEGAKLDKEEGTEVSGIQNIMWLKDMEVTLANLMSQAENVYLNTNEHLRKSSEVQTRDDRFREWLKARYPLHNYMRSEPIMHQIRAVKSDI